MNDATLRSFRQIVDAMAGDAPRTWEWVGAHMSQRMFGITQERAEAYAARHGGTARESDRRYRPCYCGGLGWIKHQPENARCPRNAR